MLPSVYSQVYVSSHKVGKQTENSKPANYTFKKVENEV